MQRPGSFNWDITNTRFCIYWCKGKYTGFYSSCVNTKSPKWGVDCEIIVLQILYCRYCTADIELRTLYYRYCTADIVLQILYCEKIVQDIVWCVLKGLIASLSNKQWKCWNLPLVYFGVEASRNISTLVFLESCKWSPNPNHPLPIHSHVWMATWPEAASHD